MLCFQFFQWRLLKQTEHQSHRRVQPKVSARGALPLWICIQDIHTDPLCSLPHNLLFQSFSEERSI